MLPRQFYVTIVENRSGGELRTATWLFPLYLVAINMFVLPIALRRALARRRLDQQRPLRAVRAAARRP
jgi:Na+/proline symporter